MELPSLDQMAKVQCKVPDNQSSCLCLVPLETQCPSTGRHHKNEYSLQVLLPLLACQIQ